MFGSHCSWCVLISFLVLKHSYWLITTVICGNHCKSSGRNSRHWKRPVQNNQHIILHIQRIKMRKEGREGWGDEKEPLVSTSSWPMFIPSLLWQPVSHMANPTGSCLSWNPYSCFLPNFFPTPVNVLTSSHELQMFLMAWVRGELEEKTNQDRRSDPCQGGAGVRTTKSTEHHQLQLDLSWVDAQQLDLRQQSTVIWHHLGSSSTSQHQARSRNVDVKACGGQGKTPERGCKHSKELTGRRWQHGDLADHRVHMGSHGPQCSPDTRWRATT